jgi:hypothetical protein
MPEPPRKRLRHRVAFFAIGSLILFVLVTLPFTITSAFQDVFGSPESVNYAIPGGPQPVPHPEHSHVRMVMVALDELQQLITMRVYIRRDFIWKTLWKERLVLFSILGADMQGDLPPAVSLDFPTNEFCSTQTVQLPVNGQPLRYPFDTYHLRLGVIMQKVYPDGRTEIMSANDVKGKVYLEISERLPRQNLIPPFDLDTTKLPGPIDNYRYMYAQKLTLKRPLYLKVLSVLLVLLVAAAASYAVFMRPLSELIVNSGALVLGVWGIRAILVAGASSFVSAVDLALSTVILFLLLAISVRALGFFMEKSGVKMPGWNTRPDEKRGTGGSSSQENDDE